MKKHHRFLPIIVVAVLFFISVRSFAQEPGNWGNWETMPCYQGITVSIVNMGHSKSAGGYLWGIRLKNNYGSPVTFRYRLSVGEKNTSQEGGDVVWKLKPGEVWTDGSDKFTAKLYQSPSTETNCYIWSVSFGDVSNCYAGCDVVKGKENQQCPVANKKPATATNTSGGGNTNTPGAGNTNTPEGKTNPTAANKTKPVTAPTKTTPLNIFSKAEAEKDARRIVEFQCKAYELFGKIMDLEDAEKSTGNLNEELDKVCCETHNLIAAFYKKYEKAGKEAQSIFDRIWGQGYDKCPYNEGCPADCLEQ